MPAFNLARNFFLRTTSFKAKFTASVLLSQPNISMTSLKAASSMCIVIFIAIHGMAYTLSLQVFIRP